MSRVTYEFTFDAENEHLEALKVTTLCAQKNANGEVPSPETALTQAAHLAFTAEYRFTERNEVEPFEVPLTVAKLLRR